MEFHITLLLLQAVGITDRAEQPRRASHLSMGALEHPRRGPDGPRGADSRQTELSRRSNLGLV
jgi:hypothetical protein